MGFRLLNRHLFIYLEWRIHNWIVLVSMSIPNILSGCLLLDLFSVSLCCTAPLRDWTQTYNAMSFTWQRFHQLGYGIYVADWIDQDREVAEESRRCAQQPKRNDNKNKDKGIRSKVNKIIPSYSRNSNNKS